MDNKLNNKGFTLVEMLAVIVILAIISGIATVGVISTINTSKNKSEKIFVDKLSNLIDDYLDLGLVNKKYKLVFENNSSYTFEKCSGYGEYDENNECYEVSVSEGKKTDGTKVNLKDLVTSGVIKKEDLVNPKNKENCLAGNIPEIKVYRDNEFVYYYYIDLTGTNTSCDISEENGIINTFPDNIPDLLLQELEG